MQVQDILHNWTGLPKKTCSPQESWKELKEISLDKLAKEDVQPAGIMERAERDISGQSLGASPGQLAQLAANHLPFERYHASEPEQRRAQWSL